MSETLTAPYATERPLKLEALAEVNAHGVPIKSDVRETMLKARKMLNDHGLGSWNLIAETNPVEMGRTSPMLHTLRLSKDYLAVNDWQENRNTILHEMAHALVPADVTMAEGNEGHGETWVRTAEKLGLKNPTGQSSTATDPWGEVPDSVVAEMYFTHVLGIDDLQEERF